jgi:tetratricopeptide (TPR) repeat protein/2-polyprenyl-3-methyl-5-hydroxy-6-metoxy-1,4-benzoquinol methylase
MGNALKDQGKLDEAVGAYTKALSIKPDYSDAYNNMGNALKDQGKPDEAVGAYTKALSIKPDYADAYNNMGNALKDQGKLNEAIEAYTRALSIKPVYAVAYNNMGSALKDQGKLDEAIEAYTKALSIKPDYADAYNNMGNALKDQGKLDEAVGAYTKALSIKPDYSDAYNNMGNALKDQGKLDEAVGAYTKALSIKPDYADAYNNMGNTLKDQGKLDEAVGAYTKALSIKPNYADAYNNMGNALKDQGKLEEAIEAYTRALSIKPDYTVAYNNMGVTLQEQGKLDDAIEAYNKALSIKPDYADAYNNMGNALKDQGKLDEAIEAYTRALSIKPDYSDAYYNMGNILRGIVFSKPNKHLQKTIVSLLDKKTYVRPIEIVKAAISLLKLEPTLQKHLELVDGHVIENPLDVISDLNEFPLLLKLMSVCPFPDLELEKLFKNLRRSILSNISSLKEAPPDLIVFQSALALQCFTNEYIYNHTDEEKKILKSLETCVTKDLEKNNQPNSQTILALASWKALTQYEWCNSLVVTDDIQEVFSRQVEEPNWEEKFKQGIPILEEITDDISSEVREQYEGSPYPRWVNVGFLLKPFSISNVVDQIKLKLHDNKITEVDEPKILIAGCGTGQHSIGTASRFKSSKVLAIDLSLSSLTYAKRKTEELAIENIEYMQADILDLGKLNKKFDIIESAGVLHHMDNPMAGWKVLTDCLKTGGLMKIGLYSELARQHIVKIRQEISKSGIGSSDTAMRSFRTMVMGSDQNHHKQILNSTDFYSLSTLKDLLFHVQEHRFTIPQVKEYLKKLGLKFCGFETQIIVSHFMQTNKATEDLYDLDKWQAYEEANPKAFAGMYQFWCQKIG